MKRITVTGRMALSLISHNTKTMSLSEEALISIGRILVFAQKKIIPQTPFAHIFKCGSTIEKHYIILFAKQLGITEEDDIAALGIHAISILINYDLNPHCDSMNPHSLEDDYTFSISIQVPVLELPMHLRAKAFQLYGSTVPLCIVVYRRKSVIDISRRMKKLNAFKNGKKGREVLVNLLASSYSDADYVGNFFDKQRWRSMKKLFKVQQDTIFKQPLLIKKEAVDKMAYWSSLLHMYYLGAMIRGMDNIEYSFSFVIFFAHQCNGTITFVSAMMNILKVGTAADNESSIYRRLAIECCRLRDKPWVDDASDVGLSKHNRHTPSANRVYNEVQLKAYMEALNVMFVSFKTKMQETAQKKTLHAKFKLFQQLSERIQNLMDGFGPLRAMHLVHLSALIGLLPLDYYIYTPMHLGGGPERYLKEYMNYTEEESALEGSTSEDKLISWTVNEMKELQEHYTTEYTPNMMENTSCIIGRSSPKPDVFFYLPWYDLQTKTFTDYDVQIMFRINGYRKNEWTLEAYSGRDSVIQLYSNGIPKKDDVILYSMNLTKFHKGGHKLNTILLSQLRVIEGRREGITQQNNTKDKVLKSFVQNK